MDAEWANELALINTPNTSFLLEITAACWFPDDRDILATQEGVEGVMAKLAEVKPNVKLWWRDEATAQQDYNSGEVSLGEFFHDITTYAISQGEPLTVFPEEGAVLDSGLWSVTATTSRPRRRSRSSTGCASPTSRPSSPAPSARRPPSPRSAWT